MKRVFVFLLVFSFCLNVNCIAIAEDEPSDLYSISAALIDGDSGRLLFGKNESEERAMASTTKIMTLILALEYGNLEDVVTVSDYAAKMPDVQMNVVAGEQYYLKDLLYAMILESYNDVAVVIAEHIGGSASGFAALMNSKAAEIGLLDTYFITSNGLDASDDNGTHHTTAYELALLMRYCVSKSPQKDEFISICQTRSYSFYDFDKKRLFSVNNKNSLLDMIDGVLAGKTGFTGDAGYCYTAAVEFNGKTYVIALLGCGWPSNKTYKWSDSKKLIAYAKENYDISCILDTDESLQRILIEDGIEADSVSCYIKNPVYANVSSADEIRIEYDIPDKLKAPVYEGDIIGCISVYVNDFFVGACNVYSGETVNKRDYNYYLKKVIYQLFVQECI